MSQPDPLAVLDQTLSNLRSNGLVTPAMIAQAKKALLILDALQPHINQAKMAGLNQDAVQQQVDQMRSQFRQFLNVYNPNGL